MSLTNYAIGAKQAAVEAQTQARPDQGLAQAYSLRKAKIVATTGNTYSIQLLDDACNPIKDENDTPIVITRVCKFPPDADASMVLVLFDSYGIPLIVNASGGGSEYGMVTE